MLYECEIKENTTPFHDEAATVDLRGKSNTRAIEIRHGGISIDRQ